MSSQLVAPMEQGLGVVIDAPRDDSRTPTPTLEEARKLRDDAIAHEKKLRESGTATELELKAASDNADRALAQYRRVKRESPASDISAPVKGGAQ